MPKKFDKDDQKRTKKKIKKILNLKYVMIIVGVLIFVSVSLYSAYQSLETTDSTMTYVDFWKEVEAGNIDSVRQIKSESYMTVEDKNGVTYRVVDPDYEDFRKDMLEHGVKVEVTSSIIVYIFIVNFTFSNIISSGNMFKILKPEDVVTFNDIAGMNETKEEVKFAVTQLKNSKKLAELGARPCKGIILTGPPGTGKKMFVGLGAARVRSLWELAEINAPCVVFIDEIDCLGRRRSGGQNSENNQTLNALLQKMDGLGESTGIFVIGATNRIDDLDAALLRPGRFDKQLYVGKPRTKKDRDELIELYLKDKHKEADVTVENISSYMRGFSGAEIAETLNEAVMVSLMENREGTISISDVNKAAMKLIAHGVGVKHSSETDRQISAIHEAGHAVENIIVGNKVAKVSIESYSSGIGGYTMEDTDKKEDISLRLKSDMLNDVRVLLAGMVSEDIKYGEHSNGCSNDLERASIICYNLINAYGMDSDNLINREALKSNGVQLFDSEKITVKANELLLSMRDDVEKSLREHYDEVIRLADRLLDDEVVLNYDFKSHDKLTESKDLKDKDDNT